MSGARVKLDEDLSPLVGEPLTKRGIGWRSVHSQGWSGATDADLFARTAASGEMLMTADKGFEDVRLYPPGTHPGIVLLRPDRDTVVELASLCERLLVAMPLEGLAGCLAVVSPRSIRIRRAED